MNSKCPNPKALGSLHLEPTEPSEQKEQSPDDCTEEEIAQWQGQLQEVLMAIGKGNATGFGNGGKGRFGKGGGKHGSGRNNTGPNGGTG